MKNTRQKNTIIKMYSCILPTSYYVIITMLVFKKALSYFDDSTAHSREATALPEPMFIKPFQLNLITLCNSQVSLVTWKLSLETRCGC